MTSHTRLAGPAIFRKAAGHPHQKCSVEAQIQGTEAHDLPMSPIVSGEGIIDHMSYIIYDVSMFLHKQARQRK